jgi:hypothetical protein
MMYMALANNNKFAVMFLLQHYEHFSLNQSYYKNQVQLSDIFIANKDSELLKHLLKYHNKDIGVNSIIGCLKVKEKYTYYNQFNMELLNTVYGYKSKDFPFLLKKIIKDYRYKFYNLYFLVYHLLINDTPKWLKMLVVTIYFTIMSGIYFTNEVNLIEEDYRLLTFDTFFTFWRVFNVVGLFFFLLMWIFRLIKVTYDNQYSLTIPEHSRDNVVGQIVEAMESNPLDIFFEDEICCVCLIKKEKTTNHCHSCKRCVKDFYFHSKLLNMCFSKENIKYYLLLVNSLMGLHCALIYFMVMTLDVAFSNTSTLNNIWIFLTNQSFGQFFFFVYLFVTSALMAQKVMAILICFGLRTTYYNVYRYHKKSIGNIRRRQNVYINAPESNDITLTGFVKNLFK